MSPSKRCRSDMLLACFSEATASVSSRVTRSCRSCSTCRRRSLGVGQGRESNNEGARAWLSPEAFRTTGTGQNKGAYPDKSGNQLAVRLSSCYCCCCGPVRSKHLRFVQDNWSIHVFRVIALDEFELSPESTAAARPVNATTSTTNHGQDLARFAANNSQVILEPV